MEPESELSIQDIIIVPVLISLGCTSSEHLTGLSINTLLSNWDLDVLSFVGHS